MPNSKKTTSNLRSKLGTSAASPALNMRQQLGLEVLEPRILLDAAAVVTGAEMAMDVLSQQDSQEAVDLIFGMAPRDEMTNTPEVDLSPMLLAELDKIVDAFAPNEDRFELASHEFGNESGKDRIIPISEVRDPLVDADRVGEIIDAAAFEAAAQSTIVFIDSAVSDYQSIIDALDPAFEVVILDSNSDGVEQMAEALQGRSDIESIHIISHGRSGTLDLGDTKLTEASIAGRHADEMAIIRSAMSETGDILLYGCDFGAGTRGESALAAFGVATGTDVAASADDTGAAILGGDWDLEVVVGSIEAAAVSVPEYKELLSAPVVDLNGPDGAGIDYETSIQPTTSNIFSVVDFDSTISSDTSVISSVTISSAGILDGASELAYHNGPAGATAFFFDASIQSATVAIDSAGTALLDVTRTGTSFTITGVGGADTTDVNIQTFLTQFLYGDLASVATEGPRTMEVIVTDASGNSVAATSTINVHYFPVADNDTVTVSADSGTAVTGNVLNNDTDPTAGDILVVSEVDSYPASVGQPYFSTYGTLTLNSDGNYTYLVDVDNATVLASEPVQA